MSQYSRQFKHSRRSRALQWAVALAIGTTVCGAAQALRVGHSRVVSAPGAPLQALVALQDLTPEELASLQVSLADEAAWQRAGLRPPVPLASMVVKVEDGPNPTYKYARIRSADALSASVVDLLLNVSSSSGQRQVQVSIVVPLRGSGVEVAPATVGTPARSGASGRTVNVKYGDTMYAIAQRNAVAGADINQMLVALWRANPKAFIQSNMNLVRSGQKLVVPDAATVRAVDPAEARRIVAEHNAAYARYRARAGAAAEASPAIVRAQEGASGAVTAAPGDASTATATPSQDRLRVSNATVQDSAAAKAEAQADAKTSADRALADAEGRVNMLQDNVNALNKAINKTASSPESSAVPGSGVPGVATGAANGAAAGPAKNGATSPTVSPASSAASTTAEGAAASKPTGATPGVAGASVSGAPGSAPVEAPKGGPAAGVAGDAAKTNGPSSVPGVASQAALSGNGSATAPAASTAPDASGASSPTVTPAAGVAAGSTGASPTPAAETRAEKSESAVGDATKTDIKTGQPMTEVSTSGLPAWLADNLLVIVTAILALIAFAIAWMLRRAGARRGDDDEETYAYTAPALNSAALNSKLNNINLDLDEPPTDEPRHVDGPRT